MRVATALGVVLLIALVLHGGAREIAALLFSAGAALLWLVPLHVPMLLLDALGWRRLLLAAGAPAASRGPLRLLWIASVREAVNRLLPVANIGGEIVGIRMTARHGASVVLVTASVVVEVLLTLVSQLLFAVLGLLCLLQVTHGGADTRAVLIAIAVIFAIVVVNYALLRYGSVFQRVLAGIERSLDLPARLSELTGQAAAVDAAVRALCTRYAALLSAVTWQLAGAIAGTLETWLALRLLDHPVGLPPALALESLTQVIRHFVFVVPAGLGVQEAGLVGGGLLLGLGVDTALALSAAKRMREILYGVPALLVWQWRELLRGSPQT